MTTDGVGGGGDGGGGGGVLAGKKRINVKSYNDITFYKQELQEYVNKYINE